MFVEQENSKLLTPFHFEDIPEMASKESNKENANPNHNNSIKQAPNQDGRLYETPSKPNYVSSVARIDGAAAAPAAFSMLDLLSPEWKPPTEPEVTCGCCFGDYPFEDMVQCTEGLHLFCGGCVSAYFNEEVYGNNRANCKCMSSEDCSGSYSYDMMQKALSPRLLKNFDELQYQAEVTTAFGDGELWQCPKCAKSVVVDDGISIITCPDNQCGHTSCRICGEAPHKDQTCEEAKQEKEKANVRSKMEEAMTNAIVRYCPGCSTKILKSEGCNKMTCPKANCQTKFCYICRETVTDYTHFFQTPHCDHQSCGKCVLFFKTEEADELARREAVRKLETNDLKAEAMGLLSPDKAKEEEITKLKRGTLVKIIGYANNIYNGQFGVIQARDKQYSAGHKEYLYTVVPTRGSALLHNTKIENLSTEGILTPFDPAFNAPRVLQYLYFWPTVGGVTAMQPLREGPWGANANLVFQGTPQFQSQKMWAGITDSTWSKWSYTASFGMIFDISDNESRINDTAEKIADIIGHYDVNRQSMPWGPRKPIRGVCVLVPLKWYAGQAFPHYSVAQLKQVLEYHCTEQCKAFSHGNFHYLNNRASQQMSLMEFYV